MGEDGGLGALGSIVLVALVVVALVDEAGALGVEEGGGTGLDLLVRVLGAVHGVAVEGGVGAERLAVGLEGVGGSGAAERNVVALVGGLAVEGRARGLVLVAVADGLALVARPLAKVLVVGGVAVEGGVRLLAVGRSHRLHPLHRLVGVLVVVRLFSV